MGIIEEIFFVVLLVFCIIAAIKDAKTTKIPNWIPLALFIIWISSIICKWILIDAHILNAQVIDVLWETGKQVITSAIICCILTVCIVIANKIRMKKGLPKTSPFGMGDIKLLMVICLYLGPNLSLISLLFACFAFIIFVVVLNIFMKKNISKYPFAPFILVGVICSCIIAII